MVGFFRLWHGYSKYGFFPFFSSFFHFLLAASICVPHSDNESFVFFFFLFFFVVFVCFYECAVRRRLRRRIWRVDDPCTRAAGRWGPSETKFSLGTNPEDFFPSRLFISGGEYIYIKLAAIQLWMSLLNDCCVFPVSTFFLIWLEQMPLDWSIRPQRNTTTTFENWNVTLSFAGRII